MTNMKHFLSVFFCLLFALVFLAPSSDTAPDDGAKNPQLINFPGVYPNINWSPWDTTGQYVLYSFPDAIIHIYNTESGKTIKSSGRNPMWSWESTKIIYGSSDGIYSIDIEKNIVKLVDQDNIELEAISPTNPSFVYTFNNAGSYQLYQVKFDGTNKTPLGQFNPGFISYIPNGQKLVFSGPYQTGEQSHYGIWLINIDGSGLEQIASPHTDSQGNKLGIFHMDVAPDGSYIIYCDALGAWKLDITSRSEEPLYPQVRHVEISPDGKQLCYIKGSTPTYLDHTELHKANIDGTNDVKIYDNIMEAYWSPDGNKLLMVVYIPEKWNYMYPYILDLSNPSQSLDKLDSDSDSIADIYELINFQNPLHAGDEQADMDKDGLRNGYEVSIGTDYEKADTDNDGIKDGAEACVYKTDPLKSDSDGDGIADGEEIRKLGYSANVSFLLDGRLKISIMVPDSSTSSYRIDMVTSSQVNGTTYDVNRKILTMNLSGIEGTAGSCDLTIPASLIPQDSKMSFSLDGTPLQFNAIEDGDNKNIHVEYTHSSHTLQAVLDTNLLPGLKPWHWVLIGIGVAGAIAAIWLFVTRKQKLEITTSRKSIGDKRRKKR